MKAGQKVAILKSSHPDATPNTVGVIEKITGKDIEVAIEGRWYSGGSYRKGKRTLLFEAYDLKEL